MKLHNSKIIRGEFAGTRMEWFCGDFESMPWHEKEGSRYIGCVDITDPSRAKSIFFISKGQPPEHFDFHKDAYSSYEQIAMAQMAVMEWDKLENGDKIRLDDEMEKNIRDWKGRIWMGGSITTIEKVAPGVHHLKQKKQSPSERDLGHYIYYDVKNEEY